MNSHRLNEKLGLTVKRRKGKADFFNDKVFPMLMKEAEYVHGSR